MNDIVINVDELTKIITKLDNKISELETIYNELDTKLKVIDGSTNIWSGDTQKSAYDNYLNISKDFPNTINQVKSLKIFLQTTLDNYLNSDKSLNEDIENNKEELDIN